MSALSNADKIRLAEVGAKADALPPKYRQAGRALADQIRSNLPDVDDVTIGRVVLELGKFLTRIAEPDDGRAIVAVHQIMCAGADLTATEWQVP